MLDKNNSLYFQNILEALKNEHLYRQLRLADKAFQPTEENSRSTITNFSSNDYLGLSKNEYLIQNLKDLLPSTISQCSSRLISGNTSSIESLETTLSKHRKTESSLVYPTGYMANLGVISCIAEKKSAVFSDELNHASIIDACRLSKATVYVFPHNNTIELERIILNSKENMKIIITEGIFSMNGDFAKLDEIVRIAKRNNCILIVDDAHGDFVVGDQELKDYSGTPGLFDVEDEVDIHISSLSKGLGCFGGYVSCPELIRNYLINKSRSFIFSSSLPDLLCKLAECSISVAKKGILQEKLNDNINYFKETASKYNIPGLKIKKHSPIIPLVIGREERTITISKKLEARGFYVHAIRYPTVKRYEGQLRISLSSEHTFEQISSLIENITLLLKH